ncbi:MAG: zinc ABC transporter substrate-binding protein [Acetobacter papayae]
MTRRQGKHTHLHPLRCPANRHPTRLLRTGLLWVLLLAPALAVPGRAETRATLNIVAVENTWGDLAAQIAGPDMTVTSLLASPTLDPHLYAPSTDDARHLADATLVVMNGAGYDTWAGKLADAARLPAERIIRADSWPGWHTGGNPHLWFNTRAVADVVTRLQAACAQADPAHASAYAQRGRAVLDAIARVDALLATIRTHVAGRAVAATEPLFDPLAEQMGLDMKEQDFQTAIMNGVEPAPADIAQFENDLTAHKLHLLAYNEQMIEVAVVPLLELADSSGIPSLPLTETLPATLPFAPVGTAPAPHWQDWISAIARQTEHLLDSAP